MRKTVTPIVAITLLIIMTISASGLAFFWVTNVQESINEQVGSSVEGTALSDCSRLTLISMRGDEAVIQNVGCDEISNVTVLIDGVLTNYDLTDPIAPGESAIITYSSLIKDTDHTVSIVIGSGQSTELTSIASENTEGAGYTDECSIDADCEDNNPCTNNTCVSGVCDYPNYADGQYTGCTGSTGCGGVACSCVSGTCSGVACGEEEGSCGHVWFSGSVTSKSAEYCACCGDDGVNDEFYNGSLATTTDFCHEGFYSSTYGVDANQTLCEEWGYDWISDSGNIKGTYSFDNDDEDSIPNGWFNESEINTDVRVLNQMGDRIKVVKCNSSTESNSYVRFFTNFTGKVSGTIEFWLNKSSENEGGPATVTLDSDDSTSLIQLRINDWFDEIEYLSNESSWENTTYPDYKDDVWIHFRIEFDCTSDTYSLWIDSVKYLDNVEFIGSVDKDSITKFSFGSYSGANPAVYYIDAVGFSWDNNYDVGDNNYQKPSCCGDDGTDDDFYNSTDYCCDGSLNSGTCHCGDGICQSWENEISCNVDCSGNFTSFWDTTQSGVSGSDQIMLPLVSGGNYNFVVYWGDGSSNTITAWDQAEKTHTYSSSGTYAVNITGTIEGWRFNDGGDKLKLSEIKNWGGLNLGNAGSYFFGCENLEITAIDELDMTGTTNMYRAFRYCSSLTTVPSMNEWDMSGVNNFGEIFAHASAFNQNISSWDMSGVTTMYYMFCCASAFNQNISSWDVSNVGNMLNSFASAESFDQDLGSWNVSGVTTMNGMLSAVNLSTSNYDSLLIGWDALPYLQTSVTFHGGNSKYSSGTAATARANIISNYGWSITDGGQE